MTREEALAKARVSGRPELYYNGTGGDHGMVLPCGCAVVTVGFTRESRWEFCNACLERLRKVGM